MHTFPIQEPGFMTMKFCPKRSIKIVTNTINNTVVFISGGENERLSRIVSFHPDRFIGFAHHYPFSEHAAETLKHAVTELGLKGYKILATTLDKPIGDKSLYELWEICEQYSIPVIIHFGVQGAAGGIAAGININPLTLHDVAKDFPEVSFVVSHLGAGYPTELLHLCWACPNVYVDTSGSNQWVRWMAYELSLQSLFKKFYETIGPERILFATDSSWFPRIFAYTYLEDEHRIMRFLRFSEEDIELILWKNARRLLKLDQGKISSFLSLEPGEGYPSYKILLGKGVKEYQRKQGNQRTGHFQVFIHIVLPCKGGQTDGQGHTALSVQI